MKKLILISMLACVAAGGYCGFHIGAFMNTRSMQSEAVEHGFAQYHPKTGDWQWGVYTSGIDIEGSLPEEIFLDGTKRAKK